MQVHKHYRRRRVKWKPSQCSCGQPAAGPAHKRRSCTNLAANNHVVTWLTSPPPAALTACHLHQAVFLQTTHHQYNTRRTANVWNRRFRDLLVTACLVMCVRAWQTEREREIYCFHRPTVGTISCQPQQVRCHLSPYLSSSTAMCQYGCRHCSIACKFFIQTVVTIQGVTGGKGQTSGGCFLC